MKNDDKIRTSVWVHPSLILLLNERGLTLSSFIGRSLPMFLDLPEDPREKLIQADLEKVVLRLRSTYEYEMRKIVKENSSKESVNDAAREREDELIKFGHQLMKAPSYPAFEKHLKNPDLFDERIMASITSEVNRMNGKKWSDDELWNYAITWWNKYGKVTMRAES